MLLEEVSELQGEIKELQYDIGILESLESDREEDLLSLQIEIDDMEQVALSIESVAQGAFYAGIDCIKPGDKFKAWLDYKLEAGL